MNATQIELSHTLSLVLSPIVQVSIINAASLLHLRLTVIITDSAQQRVHVRVLALCTIMGGRNDADYPLLWVFKRTLVEFSALVAPSA